MKVLHYIPGFNTGGIESVFLNWYKNLDRSECEFELLVRNYDPASPMLKEFLAMGGKLHTLDTPSLNIKTMWRFRNTVNIFFTKHPNYDFLHVHVADDPFIISTAKKVGIEEIGIHAHTTGYNESYKSQGLKGRIRNSNVKKANHFFACSKVAARWMFPEHLENVRIIHNGININHYAFNIEKRNEYRKKLNLKDNFTIVHVGRFSEVKNHLFMLEIFKQLNEKLPDAQLLFVGDGPLFSEYKQKYQQRNIHYLGARLDIPEVLQAADVFLLPSKFEGLGMSAIESQGAGLPTLVSNRVPQEVKVTDLVEFLPLNSGIEIWTEHIMKYKDGYERENTLEQLRNAHYDIKQTTQDLVQYYKKVRGVTD